MSMKTISKLQYVTPQPGGETFYEDLAKALEGGVDWVQLRMKNLMYNEMKFVATNVQNLCKKHHARFIINDHVDLALLLDADGVHLGLDDMPVERARIMLGHDKIIGGTANTFHDLKEHFIGGADYVGVGPLRFTHTKQNLSPVLGIDGYHRIMTYCKADYIHLPVIAIGGITPEDVEPLFAQGIHGIAISSGISMADDITISARQFVKLVSQHSSTHVSTEPHKKS